jgi:protein kinase A
VEHTLNEKRILSSISFPFLVSMWASFKDNSNLYIVLEFVTGGEMFAYLRKVAKLTEEESRFHAAQVKYRATTLQTNHERKKKGEREGGGV